MKFLLHAEVGELTHGADAMRKMLRPRIRVPAVVQAVSTVDEAAAAGLTSCAAARSTSAP